MEPREYLTESKGRLVTSAVVASVIVVQEYVLPDRGAFRTWLGLRNADFLEVAAYCVVEAEHCVPKRYRYQWMDASQTVLKKRWDTVEHFPGLPHFPHHVHVGEESHVEPGRPLSILALLDMREQEWRSSDLTEGGSL